MPPRSAPRAQRIVRLAGPPLLAFVAVRALLAVAAARSGFPAWDARNWVHWDADHYLAIALSGYDLVPCGPEYGVGSWCGNAGWFPAYPAAIRLVTLVGVSPTTAAAAVSAAATLGLLTVLWVRLLDARLAPGPLLTLALAAVFPGAVYQAAAFPVALLVLAMLVHVDALRRRQWVVAGVAGAVAASTYPIGVVLCLTGAAGALVGAEGAWRRRLLAACTVGGLAGAGALAVLLRFQVEVGRWDAYLLVQEKYGHGLNSPLSTLRSTLSGEGLPRWQTLLVAVIVVTGLVAVAVRWRRGGRELVPVALLVLAAWLMPLVVGSGVSLYRSEAVLVPVVLLLRLLPWPVTAAALVASLPLCYEMAQLFFPGVLV